MKLRTLLSVLVPAAVLAIAPAALAAGQTASGDIPFDFSTPGASAYGQFLAGQVALARGRNADALGLFEEATAAGLDPEVVRERAFIAALMSGDVPRASRLTPTAEGTRPLILGLAATVQLTEAIAEGDGRRARTLIADGRAASVQRQAAALLAPWAAATAGDKAGSFAQPELRGDKLVQIFGQLGQAVLFERARRYDEAETDYKALAGMSDYGALFAADYGAFLERRGRWKDALDHYEAALARTPGDAALAAGRERALARKGAPKLPTLREGAARAMLPAALSLASSRQTEMVVAYLGMILYLDPNRGEARLMLGDALAAQGDVEGARAAYLSAAPGSPQYASARSKLAWTYQSARDGETALGLAREGFEAAPDSDDAAIAYADLLRANERYAESAAVLDKVIARAGANPDWRLLYMRGVALERAGRWPEAERDLTTALAAQPDEPELLNYLGYSWIDRGERLGEAMDMVKRAVAGNPRSGAAIDSLGWAYYRLGDYRNAVEKLEEAVQLEPADPDINSHLGDAYWRVGRTIEAGFQWNRALGLEPSDSLKREIEGKLKSGLPVATPAVAGR